MGSKNGNIDKIRSILTLSPNLNATTTEGDTPLSLSAHRPELYFSLFRRGARAAGRIECDTAKELLTQIDSDAYDGDANPAVSISSHVRFAAPPACFVEK